MVNSLSPTVLEYYSASGNDGGAFKTCVLGLSWKLVSEDTPLYYLLRFFLKEIGFP